jgi:KDO2-lipid IV(A) lauroyltransferase
VKNNTAVVYVGFERVKRGYYRFHLTPITENAIDFTPEQLTLRYKNELEKAIRQQPANYLWSHRRWRHEWKEEYGEVVSSK